MGAEARVAFTCPSEMSTFEFAKLMGEFAVIARRYGVHKVTSKLALPSVKRGKKRAVPKKRATA